MKHRLIRALVALTAVAGVAFATLTTPAAADAPTDASAAATVPPSFTLTVDPAQGTVPAGSVIAATVVTQALGSPEPIRLSASGVPAGVTVSFDPATVTSGQTASMSVFASHDAAPGTTSIDVRGEMGSLTRQAPFALTVGPRDPTGDFSLALEPRAVRLDPAKTATVRVWTQTTGGIPQPVTLTASGQPARTTITFSPSTVVSGQSSTMTITGGGAMEGTYPVTVTGTSGTTKRSAVLDLTILMPQPPCTTENAVVNGGFEDGAAPWAATRGVVDASAARPAHSGSAKAWFAGYGRRHTDTAAQTVTVPTVTAGCPRVALSFWLRVDTAERGSTADDTLTVSADGATLATYSNLDQAPGYQLRSVDLTAFAGRTVRLTLTGVEDASRQTSFVVDDVVIKRMYTLR